MSDMKFNDSASVQLLPIMMPTPAAPSLPVRGDCLEYSTEADEDGIWGGLDQDERRNLRRKRRRKDAAIYGKTKQSEGAA